MQGGDVRRRVVGGEHRLLQAGKTVFGREQFPDRVRGRQQVLAVQPEQAEVFRQANGDIART